MRAISLIHIGDVHYPDNFNRHLVDLKDKGLNREFVDKVSPNPFQKVSKELVRTLKNTAAQAVLFSGDLTSRGNLPGYEACVDHFLNLFTANEGGELPIVHVVPGNHDIDRNVAYSGESEAMFDGFSDIWKNRGLNVLESNNVRITDLDNSNCKIKIISLNTCVGCGQTRRYPDWIREKLDEKIKEADLTDKEKFDLFCERLDTPAASQEHLSKMEEAIRDNLESHRIPVILAHHGLLPQSTIRADIYTEILNGGHIRETLNTIEYPILFCHGHIHSDPVEVVNQPKYNRSNLISISAPEFHNGFNLIELHFSTSGIPVGCNIRPFRTSNYCSVREQDSIRIRFNIYENLEDYCHQYLKEVYKRLPAEDIRFNDLMKITLNSDIVKDESSLMEILRELEWIGLISIDNLKRNNRGWIVRRVGL